MTKPKVLIYDIETSPNVVYCWQTGHKIAVGHESIIEERQIICICYKWVGEKKVHSLHWDFSKDKDKDKQMLIAFSKVFAQADMVVGHNGDRFDIPWVKTRILKHNLPPLAVVRQCDTLKEFRNTFKFNSNRLDYVAKYLGYKGKSGTSYKLWTDVMLGVKSALKAMVDYCKQDVTELEEIFLTTRPYIKNSHIHQSVNGNKCLCPSCGASKSIKYGIYYNQGQYQKFRCNDCSHIWKDTKQLKVK